MGGLPSDCSRDQILYCYLSGLQLLEKGRNIGMFWHDTLIGYRGELSLAALDGTIAILPFLLHGSFPIHSAQLLHRVWRTNPGYLIRIEYLKCLVERESLDGASGSRTGS